MTGEELKIYIKQSFQFHKGTIRTGQTLVVAHLTNVFQFHKGTIRTLVSSVLAPFLDLFQFHKGTIRTSYRVTIVAGDTNFNSIKVRLEHNEFSKRSVKSSFQFHKGTIRTSVPTVHSKYLVISIP